MLYQYYVDTYGGLWLKEGGLTYFRIVVNLLLSEGGPCNIKANVAIRITLPFILKLKKVQIHGCIFGKK